MPYDYSIRPFHQQIPDAVTGYELAPLADKGLWSIVSPSGTVTNLNTLGLRVLAYTGAGMPPIENIATPFGILGGSVLQRTVPRPRTIVLSCIAQGLTLAQVQRIKNQIIAQVAPYNSLQTSKALKLHYQLVNYCGDAIGTALEVAVTYAGDLTGSTDNLYQDRFELQFVEFAPPSIKELTTVQPSLSYYVDRSSLNGVRYRSTTTGEWNYFGSSAPTAICYDQNGVLWYGSASQIANRLGTGSQAVNNSVLSMVSDVNNNVFAGGDFTSPQTRLMVFNGTSWQAIPLTTGSPPNGTVAAMAIGVDGNLYVGGNFSSPFTRLAKYTYNIGAATGAWSSIGTATGLVRDMVSAPDGCIYVVGDFTSIGGVLSTAIAKFNPVLGASGTFTAISPSVGFTGSIVYCVAALLDGRIVVGGSFSVVGGTAVTNIAVYNGTSWQLLGDGLDSTVLKLAVDKRTGDLYAVGSFTKSGTYALPGGVARWNGSQWMQTDIANVLGVGHSSTLATRPSDGELAVSSDSSGSFVSNGVLNTLNYTGTADVYPQVKFTGPGKLWSIANYTTGKAIYFNNYTLLAGETATFTHNPAGGITFTSSFYGNSLSKILPGSDLTSFSLVPGSNSIVPYVTGGTGATKVELIYQNTHYSFEAGAPA